MIRKKITLRAAANFAGTNTQTSAIDVDGAKMVVFELSATNAQVLSVAAVQASNDGTNWVTLSSGAPATVRVNASAESGASLALNAGPAHIAVAPQTANTIGAMFITDKKMRLSYTAVAQVDALAITAYVYYDGPVSTAPDNESAGIIG